MTTALPTTSHASQPKPARTLAIRIQVLIVCLGAAGCGGGAESAAPTLAASISVSPLTTTLEVGATATLTALVKDGSGTVISRQVAWTSGNASIASVSSAGTVTGVSAGGPVTITASVDGVTASASVTVLAPAPVAMIELPRVRMSIALRQQTTVSPTLKDANGNVLTARSFNWTSSAPSVVGVSPVGLVTANQSGTATLTVSSEGKSASMTVDVIAFRAIASGYAETCAISTSDKLYCAGTRTGTAARLVAPSLRFSGVWASTRLHDISCAITTDQELYCWGDNQSGELGVGDLVDRTAPTRVLGDHRFKSVSMGQGVTGGLVVNGVQTPAEAANHTCGLTTANDLLCWGSGTRGEFGDGAFGSSLVPKAAAPGMKFSEVVVGRMYTCGRAADTQVYCWGDNEAGHVGNGSWNTTGVAAPTLIAGTAGFHGLTGGGATCALDPAGAAHCWGDNGLLKLGYATTSSCFGGKPCSTRPQPVATTLRFTAVESSQYSTCALDASGGVFCWGMNIDGKFGATIPSGCATGNSLAACTATPTPGPTGFLTLSAGPNTVCGIRSDGGAYCWGGNAFGQLGSDETTTMTPVVFHVHPDAIP